jgi:hypothetical protein
VLEAVAEDWLVAEPLLAGDDDVVGDAVLVVLLLFLTATRQPTKTMMAIITRPINMWAKTLPDSFAG